MTHLAIMGNRWLLDGQVTYPGAPAEGLLLNVRMVNAVFEDAARPDIDPDSITTRFIERLPDYIAHGIRAFTLCLQGGYPGYEGAVNSAFTPEGALRESYLARVRRVIEACDRHGAAVILGVYYQRQAGSLRDNDALRHGVVQAAGWASQFPNVALDIANEFGHHHYTQPMLCDPAGMVELITLAQQTAPRLLVSTSRQGHLGLAPAVCEASDFVLVHFNQIPLERMPALIAEAQRYGKPVMCNEDVKIGAAGAAAAALCAEHGCSWGLMTREVNQYHPPFRFDGADDDPAVYAEFKRLAGA